MESPSSFLENQLNPLLMETVQGLIRDQWIAACQFHDLSEEDVLRRVGARVRSTPKSPLVLLDLDSTLYEVAPRTLQILKEWSGSYESAEFPQVRRKLDALETRHIGYSVRDTFQSLGLHIDDANVQHAIKSAKSYWAKRFFSSEYLKYDKAYPGAALFTRHLYESGAEIIYLTGRDEPGMGEGTRANLIRDSFPWNKDRTHLLLKATSNIPDLVHKKEAANFIRGRGTLIASFENEPLNLAALYHLFPDAMHVFMETVCSDHAAPPCNGLYRIRAFCFTS